LIIKTGVINRTVNGGVLPRTVAVSRHAEAINRAVMDESYPLEKITFTGVLDHLQTKMPQVFENVLNKPEEQEVFLLTYCVSPLSRSIAHDPRGWVGMDQNPLSLRIQKLVGISTQIPSISDINRIAVPEGARTALMIDQFYGEGYEDFRKGSFLFSEHYRESEDPHIIQDRIKKAFFESCLHPEERKWLGQWHRGYAKWLAEIPAYGLQKEWFRLVKDCCHRQEGQNKSLFLQSVTSFFGDLFQLHHSFSRFNNSLEYRMYGAEAFARSLLSRVARMDIVLEWACRHWAQGCCLDGLSGVPEDVTSDLEGVLWELDNDLSPVYDLLSDETACTRLLGIDSNGKPLWH
jgi:hypothetical protein